MNAPFSYSEFTTRNIGFVTESEQNTLKNTRVFVAGVGGMGGAAVACMARMGIENFVIADIDFFEVSNMNRQIFSSINVIGRDKAAVTAEGLQAINPDIKIDLRDGNWVNELDAILPNVDIVVNGCDDIKATIQLLRKCQEHSRPCVDAFASTLPNVYVIRATDKRPEEVFDYPTIVLPIDKITPEMEKQCLMKEIEHVAVNSSSLDYIDPEIAKNIMNGTRKRSSFAPMVWTTGCLMAYEVGRLALNKKGGATVKGIFFNPYTFQVEKPKNWFIAGIRRYFVRQFFKKM
jgi:molybdopterin-synthase adenylyltransferase